jgi:hypothetical protein
VASATRVLNLLLQARSGNTFDRARSVSSALQEFHDLSGDQKRSLALLVAQRTAPELVPRIEAETGIDLSPEQTRTVIDLVARLGDTNLAELRDTIEDVEATGLPLTQDTTEDLHEVMDVTGIPSVEEAPENQAENEAEIDVDHADEFEEAEEADQDDDIEEFAQFEEDVREDAEDAEDAEVRLEPSGLPPAVLAAPDGWQRRRTLLGLIENNELPSDAAASAVASLARPTDRVWIVASLIEAGAIDLDDVAQLLDERAVGRLRRRYA